MTVGPLVEPYQPWSELEMKYVYVNIHDRFVVGILRSISQMKEAIGEIKHPTVCEAMELIGIDARNLQIMSMADIPAGTPPRRALLRAVDYDAFITTSSSCILASISQSRMKSANI